MITVEEVIKSNNFDLVQEGTDWKLYIRKDKQYPTFVLVDLMNGSLVVIDPDDFDEIQELVNVMSIQYEDEKKVGIIE